jgi:hypothetical protein
VLSPDPAEWGNFNPELQQESDGIQRFRIVLDFFEQAQFFRAFKIDY